MPSQSRAAARHNQAGLALKGQPDRRRGEGSCEEELVSCSRSTGITNIIFLCLIPYQADHSEKEDGGRKEAEGWKGNKRREQKYEHRNATL